MRINSIISYCSSVSVVCQEKTQYMYELFNTYISGDMRQEKSFFWEKHVVVAGMFLSIAGSLYAWSSQQSAMKRVCLISFGLEWMVFCYQNYLESTLLKMHYIGLQTQNRAAKAETYLDDRRSLTKALETSAEKQQELSDIVAKLSAIVLFFTQLKEVLETSSASESELRKMEKEILARLTSIEQIVPLVETFFAKNTEEVSKAFLEVKKLLEAAQQRDLDAVALIIQMHHKVDHLIQEVSSIKESLEEGKTKTASGNK